MNRLAAGLAALLACSCAGAPGSGDLRTVAERTQYRETSRHRDVQAFVRELRRRTDLVRVESMGKSGLGQDMPVLILTRARPGTRVPVVLVIANIHAGEVEGKEVSLMLARDLTLGPYVELLDRMVLVVIPNYNPDGNDAISTDNRKLDLKNLDGQVGPEGGVGTRVTGEGLNLNRDYMKLEGAESRHLSRLFGTWRPHVSIDLHTTDGSLHRFPLTYGTAHNPKSGAEAPIRYMIDRFLPDVTRAVKRNAGLDFFYYGDFREEHNPEAGWRTYSPMPRYGSNYRGLVGRMDILSEAYSYIPFRERVDATYAFLLEIFRHVAAHGPEIMEIVEQADRETVRRGEDPKPDDQVAIHYGETQRTGGKLTFKYPALPRPEPVTILSWDLESLKERRLEGARPAEYRTQFYADFAPTKSVRRPFAYVFPKELEAIVAKLREHNVRVERLAADVEAGVEAYRVRDIEKIRSSDVQTKERFETVLTVEVEPTRRTLVRDSVVVRTAQPLGNLLIHLLEPESEDGLVRWNYFDRLVEKGSEFPVLRIPDRMDLPTRESR